MKWKKYASLLLAGCMAVTMLPMSAFAAEEEIPADVPAVEETVEPEEATAEETVEVVAEEAVELPDAEIDTVDATRVASGACGDSITWVLYDDGTVKLSGSGATYDYQIASGNPLYNYRSQIKSVVIGDGITTIGRGLFNNCTNLTSVDLNNVEVVGFEAFYKCTSLKTITIPECVTYLGGGSFGYCTGLTNIYFNAVNCEMGNATSTPAFQNVGKVGTSLTVTFGDKVEKIPSYAFYYYNGSIDYDDHLKYNYTNPHITDVKIPDTVKEIGSNAFYGCYELEYVDMSIASDVTKIGENAFRLCYSLRSIDIPMYLTSLGQSAFVDCMNLGAIYYYAKNVADITFSSTQNYPFKGAGREVKTTVYLGKVSRIPASMFRGSYINKVSFPTYDSNNPKYYISEIGSYAFSECTELTTLTIPELVRTIGTGAFSKSALETIYFRGNGMGVGQNIFTGVAATAYYPKKASGWTDIVKKQYGGVIDWKTWSPSDVRTLSVCSIFKDLTEGAWYVPYIQFAFDKGLMNGLSDTTFGPGVKLSRAMIAQILYSYEGKPTTTGGTSFKDVKTTDWYYKAVRWASSTGVVSGYADRTFRPNAEVSREQLAVMLYAYAGKPSASGSLSGYADYKSVSSWATDAMKWAVKEGIISGVVSGSKTYLRPQGSASRAEAATMLMKFFS